MVKTALSVGSPEAVLAWRETLSKSHWSNDASSDDSDIGHARNAIKRRELKSVVDKLTVQWCALPDQDRRPAIDLDDHQTSADGRALSTLPLRRDLKGLKILPYPYGEGSEQQRREYREDQLARAVKKRREDPILTFIHASKEVESSDVAEFLLPIRKRYNFVRLWESYQFAEAWYKSDRNPDRLASSVSDAKLQLFWTAHPPGEGQPTDKRSVNSDDSLRRKFKNFDTSLKYGRHWWKVARGIGYGALLLMPKSSVSHRFITLELNEGQLDLWIELVLYVSPWMRNMGDVALNTLGPRVLFNDRPFEVPLLLERVAVEDITNGPDRYVPGPWMNLFAQMPSSLQSQDGPLTTPRLDDTRVEQSNGAVVVSTNPHGPAFDYDDPDRTMNMHFHESYDEVEVRYALSDPCDGAYIYL